MILQPYTTAHQCPKCREAAVGLRYMESLPTRTFSDPPLPHLLVTCERCGFQWRTRCADAVDPEAGKWCQCGHRYSEHMTTPTASRMVCSQCPCNVSR